MTERRLVTHRFRTRSVTTALRVGGHTQRGGGIRQSGFSMAMQEEQHACLEGRHTERLQTSSELAFQPQHQFQHRQRLIIVVCDASHGQCTGKRREGRIEKGIGYLAGRHILGGMRRMAQGSEVVGVVSFIAGEPIAHPLIVSRFPMQVSIAPSFLYIPAYCPA